MTTAEFIASLEPHTDQPLIFDANGARVTGGYHVTEFKALRINAIDCGGRAANWNELVLQVLPPAAAGEAHMSVAKFLSIYRRVAGAVPLPADAIVRVEYGEAGTSAVSYPVSTISAGDDGVIVELVAPTVACKANSSAVEFVPTATTNLSWAGSTPGEAPQATTGCCTPQTGDSALKACCT